LDREIQRIKFDNKDSLEMSLASSDLFVHLAKKYSWETYQSTQNEDINELWDYRIERFLDGDKLSYLIELKSQKRIARNENKTQDKWAWIELHSVRKNDKGWLLSSKADFICFERNNGFEFYNRLELIERVFLLLDMTKYANVSSEAKYVLYSRSGCPDLLTLVEFEKISDLCRGTWKK